MSERIRFVFGIATCSRCRKWHPTLLEERDGAPERIGGLACPHCPATASCSLARLGKRDTEARARFALFLWLEQQEGT
jgi:hypothetical protein